MSLCCVDEAVVCQVSVAKFRSCNLILITYPFLCLESLWQVVIILCMNIVMQITHPLPVVCKEND